MCTWFFLSVNYSFLSIRDECVRYDLGGVIHIRKYCSFVFFFAFVILGLSGSVVLSRPLFGEQNAIRIKIPTF